jgi:hypothetical protein
MQTKVALNISKTLLAQRVNGISLSFAAGLINPDPKN